MVNNKQLKRDFGFTDADVADIERSSELYASGEWPSGKTRIGRPPPHHASLAGASAEVRYAAGIDKGMISM